MDYNKLLDRPRDTASKEEDDETKKVLEEAASSVGFLLRVIDFLWKMCVGGNRE